MGASLEHQSYKIESNCLLKTWNNTHPSPTIFLLYDHPQGSQHVIIPQDNKVINNSKFQVKRTWIIVTTSSDKLAQRSLSNSRKIISDVIGESIHLII
jgi:hypothetical protein